MEDIRCAFNGIGGIGSGCQATSIASCDGLNTKCGFYKTRKQHIESTNNAIDRCRRKMLCSDCKYRSVPCSKIGEEQKTDSWASQFFNL